MADGDTVRSGDLLVVMDPTEFAADQQVTKENQSQMESEVARLRLEIYAAQSGRLWPVPRIAREAIPDFETREAQQRILASELFSLSTKLQLLDSQREGLAALAAAAEGRRVMRQRSLQLLERSLAARQQLRERGWGSDALVAQTELELNRERLALAGDTSDAQRLRRESASAQVLRQEHLAAFILDREHQLSTLEHKVRIAAEIGIKDNARLERTVLRAPIDGVVQALAITAPGQVLPEGQQLMMIVPHEAPLQIKALIANRDIAFVRPGQDVIVKIDALPFTRYGVLHGHVRRIYGQAVQSKEAAALQSNELRQSPKAIPQPDYQAAFSGLVYPVTVDLGPDRPGTNELRKALRPGMTVTVEIRTGERRVIE